MSDVARQLKRVIIRSGMSAWNVANRAGCSEATIRGWLTDRHEPSLRLAIRVAKVFGKTIELVDGEAQLKPAGPDFRPPPDTPASVAAKMSGAREFVGFWRRYQ
jgi:DNA-binding XRE family transcriptional regulator